VIDAVAGAMIGNRYLKTLTMRSLQRSVANIHSAVAIGLVSGLLLFGYDSVLSTIAL
jgi:hypothetical protein